MGDQQTQRTLKRYKLLTAVETENEGEWVKADDAAREIERLQQALLDMIAYFDKDGLMAENKELFGVRDLHWKRIAELEARVRELEAQWRATNSEYERVSKALMATQRERDRLRDTQQKYYNEAASALEERNRLRGLIGALPPTVTWAEHDWLALAVTLSDEFSELTEPLAALLRERQGMK